ncbi:hypothetical protein [Streptomyces sp. NPDC090026]|uniref:hypothetical protein n=1 Tax=Streptomyces sp. NPDC090026 TaxID=3365923 RepID=UPI0038046431
MRTFPILAAATVTAALLTACDPGGLGDCGLVAFRPLPVAQVAPVAPQRAGPPRPAPPRPAPPKASVPKTEPRKTKPARPKPGTRPHHIDIDDCGTG